MDGFQSCDKTAMFVHKTMANLAQVLHNFSFVLCTNMAAMTSGENHLLNPYEKALNLPSNSWYSDCHYTPYIVFTAVLYHDHNGINRGLIAKNRLEPCRNV